MKLAIISHTEHYKLNDGTIVGWGPTITEINHLLDIFDEIYHVAMLYDKKAPPSALPYVSNKVTFVPIPTSGGRTMTSKLNSILNAPKTVRIVTKTLKKVDIFQFRAPTGIGIFLIPYLTFFTKKKGWFKYAGNWNQEHPPFGYALQRFFLKNQSRKVTINGKWKNQPSQCLTFENPCLSVDDIVEGENQQKAKNNKTNLTFCFVGRLERQKGVERIIQALTSLNSDDKARVERVDFVGDGDEKKYFESIAKNSGVNIQFHGFLSRTQVFDIYKKAHVFVLPSSASEGFPKVIAEAVNFGCIPIVSNVSSIAQYIKHQQNGFVLKTITAENLREELKRVLHLSSSEYYQIINAQEELIQKFTFSHYNERIKKDIIKEI